MKARNPLCAILLVLPVLLAAPAGAQNVSTAFGLTEGCRLRFDHSGNLFVTQRGSNQVSKVAAGSSTPVPFASGFNDPAGLAIDSNDNLFVTDYLGSDLSKVTPAGVRTVLASGFTLANSVAVDALDNVYVAELMTYDIYRITPGGVKTLYGNANLAPEPEPNPHSHLTAIGFDASGNLWCGSDGTSTYGPPYPLSVIPAGGGTGTRMPMISQPIFDFALSPSGFFYTAGYQSNKLGTLSPGGTMADYAGTGSAGLVNGSVATARFYWPSGVAIDACSNLFVADWNNNVVRQVGIDPGCGATPTTTRSWGRLKAIYR
jgi:hypothetical protein